MTRPRCPQIARLTLRRDRAGFLLVEALATLAISGGILLGLASVLGLVLRATSQVAARAEELETTGRAVAALDRDIRAMTRARWAGTARASFIFSGAPDKIMFTRAAGQGAGARGPSAVVIQSVGTDAGGRLLRAEAPVLPGAGAIPDLQFGAVRNVYEGRNIIRLAYFARPGEGPEGPLDSWPSDVALPAAVRIGVVDTATGKLVSSVRVPVMMEAEAGCAPPGVGFCSHADPKRGAEGKPEPAGNPRTSAAGQR